MRTFIISIISVHHLFCKGPRPLVTVSTVDILVLHSTEVVHFHCESWFTLSPKVINLLIYYLGRTTGFTIKPFKGSSNKLGPLGICGPSLDVARVGIAARYTHPSRKGNIPSCAIKATTNKLEKGPYTELKPEPYSPHSCTVSPGWSLTDKSLGRGI